MKQVILIVFWMVLQAGVFAQAPSKFYCKYGGDGVDIGYGVKEIYNRQYVVIGSTSSYGAGGTDAYLMLIDSMGHLKWQQTFGGTGADVGKSVLFNPKDSGFVFAGFTSSFGNGGYDVFVVRTDKRGNKIWQTTAGGEDWDFGNDICFGSDGNLVVCGFSHNRRFGKTDGVLARVDLENGHILKERIFGGPDQDEFSVIKMTSEGLLTVVGNTKSYLDVNGDFWMMKVNSNLDSLDTKFLGAANRAERCYDFTEDRNHSLLLCGSYDTSANNVGKNASYIVRANLTGSFVSEFKLTGGGTNDEKIFSICPSKGRYEYLFSRRVVHPPLGIDIQPCLFDYNLIYVALVTYGFEGTDEAYKIISSSDNGFVMIGAANKESLIPEDVFLIKLDSTINNTPNITSIGESGITKSKIDYVYELNSAIYMPVNAGSTFQYKIIDVSGKIILEGNSDYGNVISVDQLSPGVYILITDLLAFENFKFVILKND